jgi:hypothetical protein
MKKTIFFIATVLFGTGIFAQSKNILDTPYLETQAQVDTLVTPGQDLPQHLYPRKGHQRPCFCGRAGKPNGQTFQSHGN